MQGPVVPPSEVLPASPKPPSVPAEPASASAPASSPPDPPFPDVASAASASGEPLVPPAPDPPLPPLPPLLGPAPVPALPLSRSFPHAANAETDSTVSAANQRVCRAKRDLSMVGR